MINRTVLVGRLTKDPDLRYTPNGVAACTFTLAVNRTFTNANGDREVDFIQVVTWRKQAENTADFLKKGSLAGVEGRLQSRSYEKDGKRVYVTEVVADSVQFLEPKNAREQQGGQSDYQGNQSNQNRQQQENQEPAYGGGNSNGGYGGFESSSSAQITDDDLPF